MKIEHVAMYVYNLEDTKAFFEKYFSAVSSSRYHNTSTNFQSYFLSFDGGARLEIMTRPNLHNKTKEQFVSGFIHLAFSVGSIERVNELTETLRNDGYEVLSGPRTTGDGYYESCVVGIEDNQIEITI